MLSSLAGKIYYVIKHIEEGYNIWDCYFLHFCFQVWKKNPSCSGENGVTGLH